MTPFTPATPPADLRRALLAWFDARGRDLPWRRGPEGARDPYRVWVAEILLQQTQVVRGLHYYDRFLAAFPDVHALAAASEDAVLKAWEGCGYYARARNLRRAAQHVAAEGFPSTYDGWLALPGVGPYTAAAISSLACGEARAVNDGNVRRVLARVHGEERPTEAWVQARADALLDPARPGAWNEAVMDLGATVCTPRSPHCAECPLAAACAARASGHPETYPAPKVRPAVQDVHAVALLIGDEERAVLERRSGSLLGGLMGLPTEPLAAGEAAADALARVCARLGARPGPLLGQVTHTMTHRRVTLHVYAADADAPRQSVAQAALSRLDVKALALPAARRGSLFAG
ncbi:A/G-specific adenine glycosylase [Deinococcus metalli]|uniref:Adenine DNA glycosylase n=1 Tax=Deinococcus metalli TaxID=1141878 RepID=A0A7W8NMS2_9DEIO|nr:A/G-specific adenine glycosylase [Deinococcus metalli]MBB5376114.1 A/G-specific adenine glycosylase [Deinococcus metalli]GHF40696.1 A/G-specific adenine glycosylase [Deinococcus metalli]